MDESKTADRNPAQDSKLDKKTPPVDAVGLTQQTANNPITRKLNKILESRVENDKVK